jgi:hypothetical protein
VSKHYETPTGISDKNDSKWERSFVFKLNFIVTFNITEWINRLSHKLHLKNILCLKTVQHGPLHQRVWLNTLKLMPLWVNKWMTLHTLSTVGNCKLPLPPPLTGAQLLLC